MTGCPSEDELVAMVEGALGEAERAEIEAHIDTCEPCAEVIAGLGALGRGGAGPGPRGGGGGGGGGGGSGGGGGGGSGGGRRTVGRYQLHRRIAAGGMGEVWAAWDPQLRREIAVKLVRPERADDGKERERLLREARALARLGHPNVLAVYDVGEIDGEVFIATELVAGETLASRGGPGESWREIVRLYAQAARGLAAAHAAGLVHRDVKPSNLLLGLDGRVRVADFGLAVSSAAVSAMAATARHTDEIKLTASGFVAGTPAYMAPEQRAGEPPDARADQYALCVSIVEAIAGRRPPLDLDRAGLIAFVSERRAREAELDALCGVLARGLAFEPGRRFRDTGALADALERILAGGGRELAAAATVAAAEPRAQLASAETVSLLPTPPSRPRREPRSGAGSQREPRSGAGSQREPRSGAGSQREPRSDPGQRSIAAPRSDPGLRSEPGRPGAGARSSGARSAAQIALRRRIGPIAIAGVAAAAGVAAVLVGARAFLKKPARPAAGVGSAAEAAPAPPEPPRPEPRVEPLMHGAAAVEPVGGGAGSAGAAPSPASPPSPASGAPLDLPRTPPSKTVAVAPPASASVDLSAFATDMTRSLRQHDTRACKRLIASLPGNIHPSLRYSVDSFAAYCDMMGGDCAGGTARLAQAMAAQGIAPQTAVLAEQYCPIEGPLDARLARLQAQVGAHTLGAAMDVGWCDALLAPAKKAAGEASTGPQRAIAASTLQQLARCVGHAGRCDEARALWSAAATADESIKLQKPDLGPSCAAASAALAATEAYADPTVLLASLTTAIRQRDVRACQRLVAAPIPNVHPGQKHSIELLLGHCEMLSGDCATGTARLQRIGPNASGPPVDPAIHAAWVRSNASTYCPITGDLDARLARLWSQVDAFTVRGSGGAIAWCDALVAPARTAAGEVTTDAQRKRVRMALQRLAECVGTAGRCDQGRELWALAAKVDPSTPGTPALGPRCP